MDQDRFDSGYVAKAGHSIVGKVWIENAAIGKLDTLKECTAQSLYHGSFHLAAYVGRVDQCTTIIGSNHAYHSNLLVSRIDGDFGTVAM